MMKLLSRRFLSLLLCVVLAAGMLPTMAAAASTDIGTPEELAAITDGAYVLTADITLTGDWTPISGFSGTLDGNGYTITLGGAPVFADITDTGRVMNLLLAGEVSGDGENVTLGALAVTSGGSIENCYSGASVTVTQVGTKHTGKLGGFVGDMTGGLIKNCLEYATVMAYTNANAATTTGVGYIAGATAGADCTVTACYSGSGDATKKPINPAPNNTNAPTGANTCKQFGLVDLKAPTMLDLLHTEATWGAAWTVWAANVEGIPVPTATKNTGDADKTALDAAITAALALTEADYTPATWAVLAAALTAAQETAANASATQATVNTKTAELNAAIDGLALDNSGATAPERQALADAIDAAELIEKTDLHITSTWNAFEGALDAARAVLANLSAEAQAIIDATLALTTAQAGLKRWEAQAEEPGDRLVVEVKDAQGLIGMSSNNYYKLVADFTVASSIDTLNSVLDGNGHTITLAGNPLFANIGEAGVIQNLGLAGSVGASQSRASASFADLYCRGRILNSYSKADITGKSVAAGLVGILDGGFLHNVYFSGTLAITDTANLQDARIAGLVNYYKSGAIHSAYWLEAQSKLAVSEGKYVSTSMGGLDVNDMQGESFRGELNLNCAGGLAWGQYSDGLPYHGEDTGYTPPPGTGTYTHPVLFQKINDAGEPIGEETTLNAEGLVLTLADLNKDDDAGYLSMPGYEGPIKWSTSNSSINMTYPGYDATRRDRILYASATGTATITVTDGAEKDPVVLASFQVKVTKGSLKDVKYFVGDTELTQDSTFTVMGYQWSPITAKALYLGSDVYKEVPASTTSVSVGFYDNTKATVSGRSFVLNQPGVPAKLTVSALGRSISFSATSTYVPIASITPGANDQPAAEGSPEAKYKDEDGNYVLHERNPNSASLVDFNKLQDTPNVIVAPAYASYSQNWTLESSDPAVAQFVDSLVVRVVPYKAGEITFTATAKDPKETEAQKTGTSTASFVYFNPVQSVTAAVSSLTVAENKTQALGLTFTGPKSPDGYHVSEAGMTWEYTSTDGGAVEIFRAVDCDFVRSDKEYYVSNDRYQIRGLAKGTVTAVGTPKGVNPGGSAVTPVTLTITVTEGKAEVPADIPAQVNLGLSTGISYLQNAQGEKPFSYNSEWEIFALLRSGVALDEAALEPYFQSIATTFQNPTGELLKPTTLARVALALTAAGQDAGSFRGINFFALLGDNELMTTGSNEPMWTLIALDTKDYEAAGRWTRDRLIAELLKYQNTETGGFGLTDNKTTGVDITAMSLQALAKYKEQKPVKAAIDKALVYLKNAQKRDGGFDNNCESTVQVLVALCALGLDPLDEANGFVKGINRNLIMSIMSYHVAAEPYGFLHIADTLPQVMTTDQAVYGLSAYTRYKEGRPGIYDMSDLSPAGALKSLLARANTLPEADYTAESWKPLADAKLAAQTALAKVNVTDQELTAAATALTGAINALVKKPVTEPEVPVKPEDKTITVSFRLVGDALHDDAERHSKYQTWIKTQKYTLPKSSTVYDVFEMALADHGMGFAETQHNYIGKIQAPDVLGGDWLGEFDNGPYSGWKYLVNGRYPGVGLRSLPLKDGDVVVWRYVDDFTNDFDNTDKWKEAPDVAPTAPSGGTDGGSAAKPEENPSDAKVEMKPSATTDKNGEAKAQVTAKDVTSAIADAKKNTAGSIVIEPHVKGGASKVSVELPREAMAAIAKDTTAKLTVKTAIADISLPTAVLSELGQVEGKAVAISAETVTDENGKATGEVRVEVTTDGKAVDSLMGGITVALPLTKPTTGTVLMLVTDEGAKIIKKSVVEGATLSALLPGSATVVVKDNSRTFADVDGNHWGKDAVAFATSRELFLGTGESAFDPAGNISRAMIFTVLARMEEQDSDAGSIWYEGPMLWARERGISDGTNPDGSISREELATMLYRYAGSFGVDTATDSNTVETFSDAGSVSPWATDAMAWCVDAGLLGGKGSGTIDPAGTATRAEVAAVLQRLIPVLLK